MGPVMKLGEIIDELYETRQQRLDLSKEVEELRKREVALAELLRIKFLELGIDRASGNLANFTPGTKITLIAEDWDAIYSFIMAEKAFQLLHKRLGQKAWQEYKDSGIVVPGIVDIEEFDYSLTKR